MDTNAKNIAILRVMFSSDVFFCIRRCIVAVPGPLLFYRLGWMQ